MQKTEKGTKPASKTSKNRTKNSLLNAQLPKEVIWFESLFESFISAEHQQ